MSRTTARGLLVSCAIGLLMTVGSGCNRHRARAEGPTPEEQGYLPSDFRAHAEFVTQGIIDWGNQRYIVRVSVPVVEKRTSGPTSSQPASTTASTCSPTTSESRGNSSSSISKSRTARGGF